MSPRFVGAHGLASATGEAQDQGKRCEQAPGTQEDSRGAARKHGSCPAPGAASRPLVSLKAPTQHGRHGCRSRRARSSPHPGAPAQASGSSRRTLPTIDGCHHGRSVGDYQERLRTQQGADPATDQVAFEVNLLTIEGQDVPVGVGSIRPCTHCRWNSFQTGPDRQRTARPRQRRSRRHEVYTTHHDT